MARLESRRGRIARAAAWLLAIAAVTGVGAWMLWPTEAAPPEWLGQYDVQAHRPDLIRPGTVIGTGAPEGWSNLVVKTRTHIAPDQRHLVSDLVARKASFLVTVMVADVRPSPGPRPPYRLRAVGVGVGTRLGGEDKILSADTVRQLAPDLGLIDRQLLAEAFKQQEYCRVVVQGPTMALVDTPAVTVCGGKHRKVAFRYALLVSSRTGRLNTLAWVVDLNGQCDPADVPAKANLLPPSLIDEAPLHVDPKEFNFLGIPTDMAMAVNGPPPGKPLPFSPELRALATRPSYSAEEAGRLEGQLRSLVASGE